MVVSYLHGPDPFIGHVTIHTGDPGLGVHPLIEHFKLWVLGLKHGSTTFSMHKIFMLIFLIIGQDLICFNSLIPRESQALIRSIEVVLHMTLTTDKAAHFLT